MFNQLPLDIIYKILEYNDDYTLKRKGKRIIIYEPTYKIVIYQLNYLCSITDQCSVKSWRSFNNRCMKTLYKSINHHDFHLLLNELSAEEIDIFIELETVNMLHYLSLAYYKLLNYIHKTNYPIIIKEDKCLVYGLFWDFCKFYFMCYKGLHPKENSFLF